MVKLAWDNVAEDDVAKNILQWQLLQSAIQRSQQQQAKPSPTCNLTRSDRDWVITIHAQLNQGRADEKAWPWPRLSVYNVPRGLREGDGRAYTPQVVSIGPLHHGSSHLREFEQHKLRALWHVLGRTGHDVAAYLCAVRALEGKARACYEGHAGGMASNELVQCLVLDGTFVLELLRGATTDGGEGFAGRLGYSPHDPVFAVRSVMQAVRKDMVLLENQVPLFVLDRLSRLQLDDPGQTGGVAGLAVRFFHPLMPTYAPLPQPESSVGDKAMAPDAFFNPLCPVLHCLDAFRRSLLPASQQPTPPPPLRRQRSRQRGVADKRRRQQLVHCVSELREAGVRFRPRCTDRFWDIKFEGGVLQIPRIIIDDGTKALFLNLIAFEQCRTGIGNDTTTYAIFMDNLINSAEDVGYLHASGIIEHWLGSDAEVAKLFNCLCQEVVFDINNSYLSGLSEEVNQYYGHKWSTWIASLKHNYFRNPWTIVSLIAGASILLLTITQTFYSVYSYYRPRH